jgi:hypothetical protein
MYLPQKSGYTSHQGQATNYHPTYLEIPSGTPSEQKDMELTTSEKTSQTEDSNINSVNSSTTLGSSPSGVKNI